MNALTTCFFNGCNETPVEGSIKCQRHKRKGICNVSGCRHQVNKRGVCVGHGARDVCIITGCNSLGRSAGLCSRHAKNASNGLCTMMKCRRERVRGGEMCSHHVARQKYEMQEMVKPAIDFNSLLNAGALCGEYPIDNNECNDLWSILDQSSIDEFDFLFPTNEGYCDAIDPSSKVKSINDISCIKKDREFDFIVPYTDSFNNEKSNWLSWCFTSDSLVRPLLLKDICTFKGIGGESEKSIEMDVFPHGVDLSFELFRIDYQAL